MLAFVQNARANRRRNALPGIAARGILIVTIYLAVPQDNSRYVQMTLFLHSFPGHMCSHSTCGSQSCQSHTVVRNWTMSTRLAFISTIQGCLSICHGVARLLGSFSKLWSVSTMKIDKDKGETQIRTSTQQST